MEGLLKSCKGWATSSKSKVVELLDDFCFAKVMQMLGDIFQTEFVQGLGDFFQKWDTLKSCKGVTNLV